METFAKIIKREPYYCPQERENKVKLLLVGDWTGKTSFCGRLVTGNFFSEYTPTVFDTSMLQVEKNSLLYNVQVWDTAGREDYDRLRPLSYPGTDVIILPFSIADTESFLRTETRYLPEMKHHLPKVPVLLVGMKSDLRTDETTLEKLKQKNKTVVSFEQGVVMAKKIGACRYIECSALKNENVEAVLDAALECIRAKPEKKKKQRTCLFM